MTRTKTSYSVREVKQLIGLSERTLRRWTDAGIIRGSSTADGGYKYGPEEVLQFQLVREMRLNGLTIPEIEKELTHQMSLLAADARQAAKVVFLELERTRSGEHGLKGMRDSLHAKEPNVPDRLH